MRNIFDGNLGKNNKMVDVSELITNTVLHALDRCQIQGRRINWPKLQKYVMEFFICADYRAEACIKEARLKSKYV